MTLVNGFCSVPDNMIKPGTLLVWLDIATEDSYIPTNSVPVLIGASGNTGEVLPLPDQTVNQYEEIIRMYTAIMGYSGGIGDGTVGVNGKSIEYVWSGTSLGIRQEGQATYQYVDLQGAQGIQGIKGDKGDQGLQGIQGTQGAKGEIGATGQPGTGIINLSTGLSLSLWANTKAEYDALGTYDSNTVYLISGGRYG